MSPSCWRYFLVILVSKRWRINSLKLLLPEWRTDHIEIQIILNVWIACHFHSTLHNIGFRNWHWSLLTVVKLSVAIFWKSFLTWILLQLRIRDVINLMRLLRRLMWRWLGRLFSYIFEFYCSSCLERIFLDLWWRLWKINVFLCPFYTFRIGK